MKKVGFAFCATLLLATGIHCQIVRPSALTYADAILGNAPLESCYLAPPGRANRTLNWRCCDAREYTNMLLKAYPNATGITSENFKKFCLEFCSGFLVKTNEQCETLPPSPQDYIAGAVFNTSEIRRAIKAIPQCFTHNDSSLVWQAALPSCCNYEQYKTAVRNFTSITTVDPKGYHRNCENWCLNADLCKLSVPSTLFTGQESFTTLAQTLGASTLHPECTIPNDWRCCSINQYANFLSVLFDGADPSVDVNRYQLLCRAQCESTCFRLPWKYSTDRYIPTSNETAIQKGLLPSSACFPFWSPYSTPKIWKKPRAQCCSASSYNQYFANKSLDLEGYIANCERWCLNDTCKQPNQLSTCWGSTYGKGTTQSSLHCACYPPQNNWNKALPECCNYTSYRSFVQKIAPSKIDEIANATTFRRICPAACGRLCSLDPVTTTTKLTTTTTRTTTTTTKTTTTKTTTTTKATTTKTTTKKPTTSKRTTKPKQTTTRRGVKPKRTG